MIINKTELLKAAPIVNMAPTKYSYKGFTGGLTECGYDICIAQDVTLFLGRRFVLASSIEEFNMPNNLMGRVLNKSSWARLGLDASMTTNIEPGWKGFLTLELRYSKVMPLRLEAGMPIAQVIFESILEPTEYKGGYQNQPNCPIQSKTANAIKQKPFDHLVTT